MRTHVLNLLTWLHKHEVLVAVVFTYLLTNIAMAGFVAYSAPSLLNRFLIQVLSIWIVLGFSVVIYVFAVKATAWIQNALKRSILHLEEQEAIQKELEDVKKVNVAAPEQKSKSGKTIVKTTTLVLKSGNSNPGNNIVKVRRGRPGRPASKKKEDN